MQQALPAADYYGNSASMMDIRVDSVVIPPCLLSFISLDLNRIGGGCRSQSLPLRSASRCRCHGLWLCSPHGPCEVPYIYVHIWMCQAYISSHIIDIPPVKPCRRRRHFSPRMRINRFVFLNLPALQPRGPSRRNGFASIPFTCGLRHPAS